LYEPAGKDKYELGCAPGHSFLRQYHHLVNLDAERRQREAEEKDSSSSEDEPLIDEEAAQQERIARREKWERGKVLAAKAGEVFWAWGADELKRELGILKGMAALGPNETTRKEVLMMRDSITKDLRSKYRVYIQNHNEGSARAGSVAGNPGRRSKTPATTLKTGYGQKCLHPACGKQFECGEYKVSFEPRVWTQPVTDPTTNQDRETSKTPGPKKSDEVFLDENFDPKKEDVLLAVPDYQKLNKDVNVEKYGEGKVFCVRCFEDLLEPENGQAVITTGNAMPPPPPPLQSRANKGIKRKISQTFKEELAWLRPSPIRRIYSVIFPETRFDQNGIVELDKDARETIEDWKQMLRDEGERMLLEKYPFLGSPEEDDDMDDVPLYMKQPGIGLAECLWEVSSSVKRSKTF
jgi:hypothetical protein